VGLHFDVSQDLGKVRGKRERISRLFIGDSRSGPPVRRKGRVGAEGASRDMGVRRNPSPLQIYLTT
jgi:hypothetical protein